MALRTCDCGKCPKCKHREWSKKAPSYKIRLLQRAKSDGGVRQELQRLRDKFGWTAQQK